MKVLHVYKTYFPDPPGGLQEAIRQICISTQLLGIENTIFTLSPTPFPSEIQFPEARVVRCLSWAAPASCDLGSTKSIQIFRELSEQTDLIHYYFPWPFADVLHRFAAKKPSVLTYVSDIVRQRLISALYRPFMFQTLSAMDAIVSNTPNYAETSPVLNIDSIKKKLIQIPLGINDDFYNRSIDDSIFNRIGINKNQKYFLFMGVLRYYKGLDVLVEACGQAKGIVVIAGDGPEKNSLLEKVKRLGLKNIVFCGQVTDSEKINLIQSCLALVLPSNLRSEAYGMVLVEALMFGKPLITCEIGTGTSFVNLNNETGFVVKPNSSMELAKAMNNLIIDDLLVKSMGESGRKRYEKYFSGEALGKSYFNLFSASMNHIY
jgi:glycosyltransferase involved in cell wall biosynthesis